jgi:hypothetical protein
MKKLLLASVILLQLNLDAQSSVYKPFCNNPSWTVVTTNFGISGYTTYQYQIDTTIGVHTYKKTKDVNSSSFALFREDAPQKKVYQYDITNSLDYLYIDFNLNYGDPFNLNLGGSVYSLTVCTKDSMLINGCYHNKVNLSNNGGFISYNFVEGILSEINPINPFRWPGDPQVWTTCECHSGQFYYTNLGSPFSPFSCNLTCSPEVPCSVANGIKEFSKNHIDVYPNPAKDVLNIDFKDAIEKRKIEIYDAVGGLALTEGLTTQNSVLKTHHLKSGVYIVIITDTKTNQRVIKKLVIQQ